MYLQIRQIIVFIFSICFSFNLFAQTETVTDELTFSTGMTSLSYTETSTELSGDNIAERTSGSLSSITGRLSYKFMTRPNYAFYITGSFPMLSSNTGSYFNAAVGVEFFLNELGHQTTLALQGKEIKLTPTLRYYIGVEGGGAYFTYFTDTAKKQDYGLELTATGGMIYNINKKWSLKGDLAASRGIGPATSSFVTKFFLGGVMFLGN
jgi:hypothetical protein